jgi:carbon monoxide dehydrogenase subunit G
VGSVVADVALPAPADKVWAVLSDPNRFDEWMTIHEGWMSEVPSQFETGSKMSEKVVLLGMANKVDWVIEEYSSPTAADPDAPARVKMAGTGMAGVKVNFTLSVLPDGDASTASIEGEFSGQMIVGALGKAVEKEAKKNLDESMAKLAAIVG